MVAAGTLAALTLGFFKGTLRGHVLVPWDVLRLGAPWGHGGVPHNLLLSDPVRLYAPWRALLAETLRSGRLPFWDPYVFAGNPFLANSQAAILYPPNLLYAVLPVDSATTILILLHTFWAAFGAYMLARHSKLQLGVPASLVAGVGFAFSGFALVWAEFPTFMAVLCWLPWILLALTRLEGRLRSPALVGLALSVAMAALAGHAQILQYVLLAAGLALAVICLHTLPVGLILALRKFGAGGLGIGLGLLIAAPQLLATLEAEPLIIRQKEALEGLVATAFPVNLAPLVALPRAFGDSGAANWHVGANENEYVAFVGLVCLLLAPLALRRIRRREVQILLAIETLSWSIALGTPLFQALYVVVPTINQVRAIGRATALHSLALPLLAAIGLDVGLEWLRRDGRRRWAVLYLLSASVVLGGLLLADRELGRGHLPRGLMLQQYAGVAIGGVAVLVGAALVVVRPLRRRQLALLLPLLLFGELFLAYGAYNTADPGPSPLDRRTSLTDFLRSHSGRWVAFNGEPLTGNTSIPYKILAVGGSDSFIPASFADVYAQIENTLPELRGNNAPPLKRAESLDSPILDILAVRWVITDQPAGALVGAKTIDPTPVLDVDGERVYQRRNAFPLLSTLGVAAAPNEDSVLTEMTDPARAQILDRAVSLAGAAVNAPINATGAGPTTATDITLDGESARGTVDLAVPQVALFSENWYPGWKSFVDGKPTTLLRADHTLMATMVPAGHHVVEFRYYPTSLNRSLLISTAALVLLIALSLGGLGLNDGRFSKAPIHSGQI